MQKLLKDYLDDFNKKQKKNRRAAIAAMLLVVLVVGGVLDILTQYGIAMTGSPVCGQEEHVHDEGCYASVLSCDQGETEGHTHTDDCLGSEELVCEEAEGEEHTHAEGCYAVPDGYVCGMDESEGHTHSDGCYTNELGCGQEEHAHSDACYAAKEDDGQDGPEDGSSPEESMTEEDSGDESDAGEAVTGNADGSSSAESDRIEKDKTAESDDVNEDMTAQSPEDGAAADPDSASSETDGTVPDDEKADGENGDPASGAEETEDSSGDEEEDGSDPEADVESLEDWDAQYEDVEWKDIWGEDLVTAAKMQIGYAESEENYIIAEDESHKGYTRYGHFAEEDGWYMDWDAAFVNFCLYYAGISDSSLFPDETDTAEWRNRFEEIIDETRGEEESWITGPEAYEPKTGDLVFFTREAEETEEHMGIVSSRQEETGEITVIEGDSEDEVQENTYDAADDQITAYLKLTELEAAYKGILTEKEHQQVDAVIALIEALPAPEAVMEKLEALEAAQDEEGFDAYYQELHRQVLEAKTAYDALSEKQKAAVTNAEKLFAYDWLLTDTMMDGMESVWDKMGDDEAYVNDIKITDIKTGSAPFDEKEGQGNDTTPSDKIVRTFDTVTYNFSANMKSWDISKSYREARVRLEFVLPLTEKEAVFDQTAMAWMDQTEGYRPVLTTEKRMIDGVEKDCQVLTCYKQLLPSSGNQSVVPGDFGENVTVNVLAMGNGEEFAPIFSAAMEGGAWDKPCDKEEHKIDGEPAVEKKTVTADKVKVTAAPKYNIQVNGTSSYHDEFDFRGDDEWLAQYGETAANTDIMTPLPGRAMVLGVTLQLYNDNAAKGLKGIELPDGSDITFDLKLSSTYTLNQPKEGFHKDQTIADPAYAPLLWSYNEVDWKGYGDINKDGRPIYDALRAIPYAPYYAGNGEENACFNSGQWRVTQEGDTLHVTVSGYEIDTQKMPKMNGDWGTSVKYDANVGCFSSGEIWLIQPFNKKEGEGREPNYDIVEKYGQGYFATTAEATNLKATTASGTKLVEGENGFDQAKSEDDGITRTLELTLGGALHNRVRYADAVDWKKGSGIEDNRDGRDFAAVGAKVNLMGGLSYNPKQEAKNQMYLGTTLLKFYGSALELEDEWFLDLDGGAALNGHGKEETGLAEENVRIYYAVKPDGEDWNSDEELLHTYEDQLVFYDSLDQIPDGKTCVGMLIGFVGPGAEVKAEDPYYNCFHKAKVKDDANLIGQTLMLASTSRVWTKEMFTKMGMTLDDINLAAHPELNVPELILGDPLWNCGHYTSANIGEDTFYKKETYRPDGSGIYGTHNSDWSHWGDTLLVIGYKTKVSKYLMQKENNGGDKQTFNLDADQRVVDFKLEPGTYFDQPGNFPQTTTVTIVDTLPKYLTYKAGSSYFGGSYKQTSVNGGTQGNIVEDTSESGKFPTPVLKEPEVVANADGTQTLTWTLQDVKIGTPMAPIYYSANIGSKGNPNEDVPTGTTNLENKVHISAPGDLRDPVTTGEKHSEAGIAVTRGSASSFGKYTKQKVADEDGVIDYVIYYNNNAESKTALTIMDTMPMNEENGSHFTGTYTFAGWKLDPTKCNVENIQIYYTFDTGYKDKTTKDVTEEEIKTWKPAAVDADGTIAIPTEADGATKEQPCPVAWAVTGILDSGQSVNIDLRIQLDPGVSDTDRKENNYFVNLLSSGDTTTTTETPTVRRTLEGLTWMDYNRDGLQDDPRTEVRISGVKVELLRLREGGDPRKEDSYESVCYPGTTVPIVIETGKQVSVRAKSESQVDDYEPGRYKFTDLQAGIYAVRFTDGSGETKITELNATSVDCGEDDRRDSDAVASRDETGKLVKTTILDVEMPKAEDMNVSLFESKFHDSGFYPDTHMTLQKVDESGNALSGAIFTLQDDSGETLSFIYDEERGYTPWDEEGEESRKDKYYIALASNPYYVIGINGTENGSLPVLQNRTGNDAQLFEILKDGDGYYSFCNAAGGKCLDLDSGVCEDGAKVHVWSGDPDTNKKWYLTEVDGGFYISPLGGKLWGGDRWCLDLDGGTIQENQKIHLWSKNNSSAQKWVLIPAGTTAQTQTDLNVDTRGGVTINNLKPGSYTITELKSPAGHSLLREPVSFTVNGDGSVKSNDTMAVEDGDGFVLKIKNKELYELPSAGGIGTWWYTIGGTLLMMAGVLILYKKKMQGGAGRIGR